MFLAPVSQRVYFPKGGSYSTILAVASTFTALPFVAPAVGFTPDLIGVNVTAAGVGAGADVRLAIYDDINGRPGNLVADFGAITALIAIQAYSVALSAGAQPLKPTLTPGKVYWLASVFNVAATTMPTVSAIDSAVANQDQAHELGVASLGALPSSIATGASGVGVAMTYGAFPVLAPAAIPLLNTKVPLVGLRHV